MDTGWEGESEDRNPGEILLMCFSSEYPEIAQNGNSVAPPEGNALRGHLLHQNASVNVSEGTLQGFYSFLAFTAEARSFPVIASLFLLLCGFPERSLF